MWRLVGLAWHGQACAGTVDNTVSSGEITEATDNVHCRAAYFRFTVGKIPIRIDANGRSGACDDCGLLPPFSAAHRTNARFLPRIDGAIVATTEDTGTCR